MTDTPALRLQGMSKGDQVLVLSRLASSPSQRFRPTDIMKAFKGLRLPAPGNIHHVLGQLRRDEAIVREKDGRYALTPQGRVRSIELMGDLDVAVLDREARIPLPAAMGHTTPLELPAALAPPELIGPLRDFLKDNPFEQNVFGMTRFPRTDDAQDPIAAALGAVDQVCVDHGLSFHLADDMLIHRDLWTNVMGHMWGSRFGIALFEDRLGEGVNVNLSIEVGAMLMSGRRMALLKDRSVESMPTDLVGQVYLPVELDRTDEVARSVHAWLRDAGGGAGCPNCPEEPSELRRT